MRLLELMTARDVDSEMKKLGISKIPLSSKGERVLQGMTKEKFIDKVTNMERLIYFVESLGDKRWLYHTKREPLSPLVNKFKGDIEGAEISFGAKLAAYHVAMNIRDRKEVDSPYEMMKEYFKSFGMQMSGSKTFDMAVTNLEQWMKRNKMMKLTESRLRKLIREEIKSINEANEGDRFVHKYSPEIEIELIEPTNRGWKVKQTTGRKSKTAFFDKGDIMGAKAIFKPIKESLQERLRKIIREEIKSIKVKNLLKENNIISKLNAVKSKLSPLSSLYIQSIIDDKGVIEDLDNTGNFVTIEDIKLWGDNKLVLTYRLYNKKSESGGYQTIASFYGDVDEILSNLNHLIFNVVYSKKKKFEDIKIDFKTNNKVANKYRYDNRFNESMNEFVNVDDYLKDGGYEFLHSYGLATLKYGGKVIAKGGEDFDEAEDGYLMKHSSWRDEKVFDTARDVIDYFKKRRIKRK